MTPKERMQASALIPETFFRGLARAMWVEQDSNIYATMPIIACVALEYLHKHNLLKEPQCQRSPKT